MRKMQVVERKEVMMEVQVSGIQVLHLVPWTSVMHLLRVWVRYRVLVQGQLLALVEVCLGDSTQPSAETEWDQCFEGEQAAPEPYFV